MTSTIDFRDRDKTTVAAILRAHLPRGALVWVYGSRAKGRAKRASDLDLAIDAGRSLTFEERAELAYAFEVSDLPWNVDVVDWRGIQPTFRARMENDRQPFPFAESVA